MFNLPTSLRFVYFVELFKILDKQSEGLSEGLNTKH